MLLKWQQDNCEETSHGCREATAPNYLVAQTMPDVFFKPGATPAVLSPNLYQNVYVAPGCCGLHAIT